MNRRLQYLLLFTFLLPLQAVLAQTHAVALHANDSSLVYFSKLNSNPIRSNDSIWYDTMSFVNPAAFQPEDAETFYQTLGSGGMALQPLLFLISPKSGFSYGRNSFDPYRYQQSNTRFFSVLRPFTDLRYQMGKDREQTIEVLHSQNVWKGLSLGLQYRLFRDNGHLARQKSDLSNFALKAHFLSENQRYEVYADYLRNRFTTQENGGLVNDSLYRENTESDPSLYAIRLSAAEGFLKASELFIQQQYHLEVPGNSVTGDSINRKFWSLGTLMHRFKYSRETQRFRDENPASGYYYHIYADSLLSLDSIYQEKYENELLWTNIRKDKQHQFMQLYFGVGHELAKHEYGIHSDTMKIGASKTFQSIILKGGIRKPVFKSLTLNGQFEYISVSDYNAGDFSLEGSLEQVIGRDFKMKGGVLLASQQPDYFYSFYQSNHFKWEQELEKTNSLTSRFQFIGPGVYAGLDYSLVSNFMYMGQDSLPHQFSNEFSVLSAQASYRFRWKKMGFTPKVLYQLTNKEDILPLPQLAAKLRIDFSLNLFDGVLKTTTGLEASYFTAYYAPAYIPALRSFVLQDETKIGGYPYADVFITAQLKRARFSLRYMHVNQGWPAYDHFGSPGYALEGRGFKFGLSWMFHD